ncbi:hypothetical protein WJX72_009989 [[Myrmecia] bisecta]|uniref:Uncharacterized protein n=1 Tax=[Myrmecia] bisecta TaxID=41462 RepID=A0AAW1PCX7_9CHLO
MDPMHRGLLSMLAQVTRLSGLQSLRIEVCSGWLEALPADEMQYGGTHHVELVRTLINRVDQHWAAQEPFSRLRRDAERPAPSVAQVAALSLEVDRLNAQANELNECSQAFARVGAQLGAEIAPRLAAGEFRIAHVNAILVHLAISQLQLVLQVPMMETDLSESCYQELRAILSCPKPGWLDLTPMTNLRELRTANVHSVWLPPNLRAFQATNVLYHGPLPFGLQSFQVDYTMRDALIQFSTDLRTVAMLPLKEIQIVVSCNHPVLSFGGSVACTLPKAHVTEFREHESNLDPAEALPPAWPLQATLESVVLPGAGFQQARVLRNTDPMHRGLLSMLPQVTRLSGLQSLRIDVYSGWPDALPADEMQYGGEHHLELVMALTERVDQHWAAQQPFSRLMRVAAHPAPTSGAQVAALSLNVERHLARAYEINDCARAFARFLIQMRAEIGPRLARGDGDGA